jgi:hypothetical protein
VAVPPVAPLEELRARVHSRGLLDTQVEGAARRALAAGVHRTAVAVAIGISRASVYQQLDAVAVGPCWYCNGRYGVFVRHG